MLRIIAHSTLSTGVENDAIEEKNNLSLLAKVWQSIVTLGLLLCYAKFEAQGTIHFQFTSHKS